MINVYRAEGPFTYHKKAYSIRSINASDLDGYLQDGWSRSIEEALQLRETIRKPNRMPRGADHPIRPRKDALPRSDK